MFLQLLFFPKGVEINDSDKTITVHYFFMWQEIIESRDILSYTNTKLGTKSTIYEGVLVKLKNGKKYLFDDINITNYKPVKSFLEDCKIDFLGDEKFNNISYFKSFFKY